MAPSILGRFLCIAALLVASVGSGASTRWISSGNIRWRVPRQLVTLVEAEPSSVETVNAGVPTPGTRSVPHLAVSADGIWFATGARDGRVFTWKMPDCVVTARSASCSVERRPLLQRFVLSSPLTVLGILDDLHVAMATQEDVTVWNFNNSERPVAELKIPGVVAMDVEDSYMLLGCKTGRFYMANAVYRDDWVRSGRFHAEEGVPRVRWSFSLARALGQTSRPYEITTVALCRGNYWFAISAWDANALTGVTLLWNLHWDISPENLTSSDGRLSRFFADISPILAMRFSPSAQWLIKGCESGVITFWQHLLTKHDVPDIPQGELVLPWPVRYLEVSTDTNWLVASDLQGHAQLYQANFFPGEKAAVSFDLPVTGAGASSAVAFSADLGWLLVAVEPGKILAQPLELRMPKASYTFGASGNGIRKMLLSPKEEYLLTGSLVAANATNTLYLWPTVANNASPLLNLPLNGTFCCMASDDKATADFQVLIASTDQASASSLSKLHLWKITGSSTRPKAQLEANYTVPDCNVKSLAYMTSFAILGCSRRLMVLRLGGSGSASPQLTFDLPPMVAATALVVLGDDSFAFGSSQGDVCVGSTSEVRLDTSRCFYPGGRINVLKVSDDAKEIFSGSSSGSVCRLFLEMGQKNSSCFTQPGAWPDNEVLAIAMLRGQFRLASSSANGMLAVWDLEEVSFGMLEPVEVLRTNNYQARIVVGQNSTYYYVSGTLNLLEAYVVNSIASTVRRIQRSQLCRRDAFCSTNRVRSYQGGDIRTRGRINIPSYIDNLPLEWLSLQGANIGRMAPRPPISMRKVNLSGTILADWRSLQLGWWSVPSEIDVRSTSFAHLPIVHGEAMRLVTDANCIAAAQQKESLASASLTFCILRAPQFGEELCASHFISHSMTADALAARVTGTPLPILTQIYVDLRDFYAWLCDCPAGSFGPNGSHCEVCPLNHYCPPAGNRTVAENVIPKPCPPNSGTTRTGLSKATDCQCLPGFFADHNAHRDGPYNCQLCPAASTSGYGSWQCHSCFFGYRPVALGDEREHGDCTFDWFGVVFFVVLQIAMLQLGLMYWLFATGLPINDVSKQTGRWVVSTCGWQALWLLPLLKKAHAVSFRQTGNRELDEHLWEVETISGIGQRFVLVGLVDGNSSSLVSAAPQSSESLENGDLIGVNVPEGISLDTSQGFLHFRSHWVLLFFGRIPEGLKLLVLLLLPWPFWMKAFHQQDWLVLGLAISSAVAVILLVLASLLLAPRPAIEANLSNFRHGLLRNPKPLDVQQRAVDVVNMSNLLVQFQFFIGSRNAHYVNSNILLPITTSHGLSFAEMLQRAPKRAPKSKYFVSHWWGAPFERSMQSIYKHAHVAEGNHWKEAAYWCCLFSVNQWHMEEELGNGDLAKSSFYLALTDPSTRATLLLLDDEVGCLSRSWCLFEVLQTCLRARLGRGFEGLLLCTPSGVMNKDSGQQASHVSIDTAIATAQRLLHLRFEDAQATSSSDKDMIDRLVARYPGRQPAMNGFVQHHIREALSYIKEKHNHTFVKLMNELASSPKPTQSLSQPSLQWNSERSESPSPRALVGAAAGWFSWLRSRSASDWFGWSGSVADLSDSGDSDSESTEE